MAEFIMENPDNRVEYDIWFSSSDDRALDFIRDFEDYHLSLGDAILMTLRYVSWACPYCEEQYCSLDHEANSNYGNLYLKEDLRQ